MVTASPVESRVSIELRPTPSENTSDATRRGAKPNAVDAPSDTAEGRSSDEGNAAYNVTISDDAHKIAASAPQRDQQPADRSQDAVGDANNRNGVEFERSEETNQTTSYESERRGNDTRNETEAGRTLGQVIDAYA